MTKDSKELAKALAENEKLRAELREALEEKAWLAKCAREALEEKVWLAKELLAYTGTKIGNKETPDDQDPEAGEGAG